MADEIQFAATRSHNDAKVAIGLARSAAWAAVALNGIGALAVLVVGPLLARFAAWAFGLYALGALLGVAMLYLLFQWIETWNEVWEAIARDQGAERLAERRATAERIKPWVPRVFAASLLLFLLAGGALTCAMFRGGAAP